MYLLCTLPVCSTAISSDRKADGHCPPLPAQMIPVMLKKNCPGTSKQLRPECFFSSSNELIASPSSAAFPESTAAADPHTGV